MIADGSGYNQNIAADLYQYGEIGLQPWEHFPSVRDEHLLLGRVGI